MKVRCVRPAELREDELARWAELQESVPGLDSPYFRPEFTLAVASVRPDVEVALLEVGGEPIGFLPFQREAGGVAQPVGGALSDFHGLICRPEQDVDLPALLRACGLARLRFANLPAAQPWFEPYRWTVAGSPYMDLSRGFEAFEEERRQAGTKELVKQARKTRKLEREVGERRFVFHSDERAVLDQLVAWKSEQYAKSSLPNVFSFGWPLRLIERTLAQRSPAFGGVLSALYVGERLLAVHFGIRSGKVLHSWFPAYDLEFYRYSPGLMLLVEIARAAPELGVGRFDLGKGPEDYKQSFRSGEILLAEGVVDRSWLRRTAGAAWARARERIKRSPLRGAAQRAARLTRPLRFRGRFR